MYPHRLCVKACVCVCVWPRRTAGQVSPFRAVFDAADKDDNESLSMRELQRVLRAMGTRATIEELLDMVRMHGCSTGCSAVQYRMLHASAHRGAARHGVHVATWVHAANE